jgi:hypothetical protein
MDAWAQAQTITNYTEEALRTAMANGGLIRFACNGTVVLNGTITNDLDTLLDSNGHDVTISGGGFQRVLVISSNVSLTLVGLRIVDGRGTFGGAGVYNDGGHFYARSCTFSNNIAFGSYGQTAPGGHGSNVYGGALFNRGTAMITESTFVTNVAVGSMGGDGTNRGWTACGSGGDAGKGGLALGGAIYNCGQLELLNSALVHNTAAAGTGGEGGRGGGGCIGGGTGGNGGCGGCSYGGALYNAGAAHLLNTTLSGNLSAGGPGGAGGSGGTLFPMYGGDGGNGDSGGSGCGGGLYDATGSCFLTNCTLALNSAVAGPAGRAGYGGNGNYGNGENGLPGQPGSASGGGVEANTSAFLVNALLDSNAPENLSGTIIDGGHNLSSDLSGFTAPGSMNNTAALLGPLAYNTRSTPTHPLLPGSPAIDAGETPSAPGIDQRGVPRPVGAAADIGAFEAAVPGIVAQAESLWAPLGSRASFSVAAEGYPPLSYQWFFNSTQQLHGATSPVLQLTDLAFENSGNYTLMIANSLGAATSSPARLEVFSRVITQCSEMNLRSSLGLGGTVTFACDGTFTLSNPLAIETDTALDARGYQVDVSGGGLVRLFQVPSNVSLSLVGLTISRGFSTNGGAVWSAGTVNATNCIFIANQASGTPGPDNSWPPDGQPGCGGAVYNLGSFNAERCAFVSNSAQGGAGAEYQGGAGGIAAGGAIYSQGEVTLSRSLFASNSAAGGPGGQGPPGWAGGDQAWPGGAGGKGGDALASAVFNSGGASAVNCTVAWNIVLGGVGGEGGPGGWVWHDGWLFTAPPGDNGAGGNAWSVIYSTNASLRVTNCTIAFNSASAGLGGSGTMLGALAGNAAMLVNTILAHNAPSNVSATISDAGHNLSSDSSGAFTGPGSLNNADPGVGPLADNTGPTLTIALLPGSPAIDSADVASAPLTDQRGGPRPAGNVPDIGAYEYGSVLRLLINPPRSGTYDLTVREIPLSSCRLQTSVDLNSWISIATNQVGTDGTALFHVPVNALETQRFYRANIP